MRYIEEFIQNDLNKKMVFLGGPRQVGKTTLAKSLIKKRGLYFNWDDEFDRKAILVRKWSDDDQYLIFDELHKFPRWKNWIKGIYDTQKENHKILVIGSARLDLYKKGGDSLLGRYHYYRLHPFTLNEVPKSVSKKDVLKRLMKFGGFPEPFLSGSETENRRWRKERFDRILKDDIRELEVIKDINNISLLVDLLKSRVGSPIVVSNLENDLQVASNTVKNWITILEKMYLVFKVPVYTRKIARSLQKPVKIYFYDNADVDGDEGARFENLVATHLLKMLHYLEDTEGYKCELFYIRDKDGREVDFCVVIDGKVVELVEAKLNDSNISKSLIYFSERLEPQKSTQILFSDVARHKKNNLVLNGVTDEFAKLNRWK
ncbi:MAG: ATP-binding protein [Pseudobdellovibrio sp.]